MMQLEFVHDEERFQDLAGEWDRLLERTVTRAPFLLHAFQSTWWRTGGGGEWPQAELWLALGREQDGRLAAVAPLFKAGPPGGEAALRLIGSVEIADVLDFIAPLEALERFVPALLQAVEAQPGITALDLYNLPEASPTLGLLKAAGQASGWAVEEQRLQPSPFVRLDSSWEAYLEGLDSKQRRELKRKIRRAESYPARVDWRLEGAGPELEAHVDEFLDLMALDSEKQAFLTPSMRAHFHALARAAADQGWLQLALLEVGGQPAFGYFNFDFDGKLWIYNSGFDPRHASLSPGWVLMGRLIQWAIDNGRHEVDFLRGDEEYKYRLGGVDRYVSRLLLER